MRLGTLLALSLWAFGGAAAAQSLAMKEQNGVHFACGGVGADEREALAALRSEANLELLFVTAKRGGYLADVAVAVQGPDAASPRLEFTVDGPQCVMRVPEGRYRIEASYAGHKRVQQTNAGRTTGKPARVVFSFPGEPWDGIWASDEEKKPTRGPGEALSR